MRTSYLLSIATILILSGNAYAQQKIRYSTLSLSGGIDPLSSKDDLIGFNKYSGVPVAVNSIYTRFTPKGQHMVDFTFSGGQVESVARHPAKSRQFFFNYDYMYNLKTKNKKLVPSLGMGLHTIVNHIDYYPGFESTQKYWSAGSFLTLSGNVSYQLGERSSIRLHVALPIVGVINRRNGEYEGSNYSSFTSFTESALISAKLEYCYQINAKLGLLVAYRYNYFRLTDPRHLSMMNNGVFLGLRISL
ncbi:MAG: hypothetical protein QM762_04285 [Chryseolinea sp.]